MNIALLGYGKMGKAIEEIALQKGHDVVLRIDDQNLHELTVDNLQKANVAIEFTNPESAASNILKCFDAGVPVVCGTTGWLSDMEMVLEKCKAANGTFLYASNFSIGVNFFFEVSKKLASLMQQHPEYDVNIEEIHHTAKKDAPSGTAITLAEDILAIGGQKKKWSLRRSRETNQTMHDRVIHQNELLWIDSKRIDPAAGTHIVKYTSPVDDIEITHTAHNRKGFAAGALLAAEFIFDKKGIFEMKNVLGF